MRPCVVWWRLYSWGTTPTPAETQFTKDHLIDSWDAKIPSCQSGGPAARSPLWTAVPQEAHNQPPHSARLHSPHASKAQAGLPQVLNDAHAAPEMAGPRRGKNGTKHSNTGAQKRAKGEQGCTHAAAVAAAASGTAAWPEAACTMAERANATGLATRLGCGAKSPLPRGSASRPRALR